MTHVLGVGVLDNNGQIQLSCLIGATSLYCAFGSKQQETFLRLDERSLKLALD